MNMRHRTPWKRMTMLLAIVGLCTITAKAQELILPTTEQETALPRPKMTEELPFRHLDVSLTAGMTGLGFDVASPIDDMLQLRAGFSFMPHFSPVMHFGVQVGDNPKTSQSKFDRLSGMLETLTGYTVDNHVDMIGQPTYWNFNLMMDFRPFKDKNWHLTAGLYIGPSKVARAFNTTEDMPSLMAVGIYNNLYNKVINSPVLNDPDYFIDNTLGDILANSELLNNFDLTSLDIYLDPDVNPVKSFYERIADYGRMGIHIGDYRKDIYDGEGNVIHKKGDPYMMEPDANSMVKASVRVNSVKPYLGFGYGGKLLKNDDSWKISFDAGMMLWGGTPKIVTHDGTDLIGDVNHVRGKVGDYVDFINSFKVFPVLNVRITKNIF